MRLLDTISVDGAGAPRRIDLYQGDLTSASSAVEADILIVSAFRGDYTESRSSLIGALHYNSGLSLRSLANDKEIDLRSQFSCWLSKPMTGRPFTRILCIESGWRGTPPEITDDLFRALSPILLSDPSIGVIAMPIIGAGDQGFEPGRMLELIVEASIAWMKRGLPLKHLKIVTNKNIDAPTRKKIFSYNSVAHATKEPHSAYDIFVSYSHKDADIANFICKTLLQQNPNLKIFIDHSHLQHGGSWPCN